MGEEEKITEEDKILVIKAKFRSDALNVYGLGILIFNKYIANTHHTYIYFLLLSNY